MLGLNRFWRPGWKKKQEEEEEINEEELEEIDEDDLEMAPEEDESGEEDECQHGNKNQCGQCEQEQQQNQQGQQGQQQGKGSKGRSQQKSQQFGKGKSNSSRQSKTSNKPSKSGQKYKRSSKFKPSSKKAKITKGSGKRKTSFKNVNNKHKIKSISIPELSKKSWYDEINEYEKSAIDSDLSYVRKNKPLQIGEKPKEEIKFKGDNFSRLLIDNMVKTQERYEINQQRTTSYSIQDIEDKHLSNQFSMIIAKLAEDYSYVEIIGDDDWDIVEIMKRSLSHKPLLDCRLSYEKEKIALLLDTSPSCRKMSAFYSKLATAAIRRNDIDIYIAPNNYIEARYDRQKNEFVVDDSRGEWGLDGRIVITFTDWDGSEVMAPNSRLCQNVYWFDRIDMPHNDVMFQSTMEVFRGTRYVCQDEEQFIQLCKKIK